MDALETAKSDERRSLDRRKLEIKLDDLISRQLARVSNGHFGVYLIVRPLQGLWEREGHCS